MKTKTNKTRAKKMLVALFAMLMPLLASAHDFEVNGIYYKIISSTDLTVEVTYRGNSYSSYYDEYSGAITIPQIVNYNKTYNVIGIGDYAFASCSNLTSVEISEGIKSIGSSSFDYCNNLNSITIPTSLEEVGFNAFFGMNHGLDVHISSIKDWCEIAFEGTSANPLYYNSNLYLNGELITELVIPDGVEKIKRCAFPGCKIKTVIIPNSVTEIGSTAFGYCEGLISINIPEGVKSIDYDAFKDCSNLVSIGFPSSLTSVGNNVFTGTKWYDNQQNGAVYIGTILYCYKGEMPSNTSVIVKEGTKCIGNSAFENCTNLSSITLPSGLTTIDKYAFYGCCSLTDVTIPESVTSIGSCAFFDCSSLTSIDIPTNVSSIELSTFNRCTNLESISLPDNLKKIDNYAFSGCSSLQTVYCYANQVPTVVDGAFTTSSIGSATLYVPANSLTNYQGTDPWNTFADIQTLESLIPSTVTLTISEYGSGTYCSPYALDFSEVEGLKAYAATGYDSETGVVTLTRVITAKAGMGLFVKGEPDDYVVPILESTSFNTLNMLVGTLEDVIVNGTDGLYTNYKYAAPDGEPLFYQFADGSTQKAGRAYLQIPTSWLTTTAAKSISYRFDDGETTDIENSEITTPNSEFIYDLYGRRVENPVKGGVYIVKGKKIVY